MSNTVMNIEQEDVERAVSALERIALTLAAIHVGSLVGIDQGEKARRLSAMGFSNTQIANALGTTSNTINVALHKARQQSIRKKTRSK
jgi:hypothetical protein